MTTSAAFMQTRSMTDEEVDTAARKLVDTLHAEGRTDGAAGLVAELRNRFWARAARGCPFCTDLTIAHIVTGDGSIWCPSRSKEVLAQWAEVDA